MNITKLCLLGWFSEYSNVRERVYLNNLLKLTEKMKIQFVQWNERSRKMICNERFKKLAKNLCARSDNKNISMGC